MVLNDKNRVMDVRLDRISDHRIFETKGRLNDDSSTAEGQVPRPSMMLLAAADIVGLND